MPGEAIVFVINSLAGGGAERAIVNLLAHSGDELERHDVHLVLLDSDPEAFTPPPRIMVHRLNARHNLWRSMLMLRRVFRRIEPRVVVSALTRSNICITALAGQFGYRTIISEHAHTTGHHTGLSGFIAKGLIRLFYPKADIVIGVSQAIISDLVRDFAVSDHRAFVIPNPIDATAITRMAGQPSPLPLPASYIVGMGRLIKAKNFRLLIQAFAQSDFTGDLIILGEGPERQMLETQIAQLGLATRVHLPGFLKNPFPVIKGAAGFVLSSDVEGLPTCLIEAMTLGIPVISTNCRSGPSEILANQPDMVISELTEVSYGLLVPPGSTAALASALNTLNNPAARSNLATRAQAGTSRYALQDAVGKYWSIIEEQLGRVG